MRHFDKLSASNRGFIVNIVAIVVVLGIVFLSQPSLKATVWQSQTGYYLDQAKTWFSNNVYPRISSEVQVRGGELARQANEQKDMVAQSLWDKIKIFFQEKFNGIFKTNVK